MKKATFGVAAVLTLCTGSGCAPTAPARGPIFGRVGVAAGNPGAAAADGRRDARLLPGDWDFTWVPASGRRYAAPRPTTSTSMRAQAMSKTGTLIFAPLPRLE